MYNIAINSGCELLCNLPLALYVSDFNFSESIVILVHEICSIIYVLIKI